MSRAGSKTLLPPRGGTPCLGHRLLGSSTPTTTPSARTRARTHNHYKTIPFIRHCPRLQSSTMALQLASNKAIQARSTVCSNQPRSRAYIPSSRTTNALRAAKGACVASVRVWWCPKFQTLNSRDFPPPPPWPTLAPTLVGASFVRVGRSSPFDRRLPSGRILDERTRV